MVNDFLMADSFPKRYRSGILTQHTAENVSTDMNVNNLIINKPYKID